MLAALLTLSLACTRGADPLSPLDREYVHIMNALGIADRDTTRNVLNREARRRKIRWEQERMRFFRDPGLERAIEEALASGDQLTQAKARAYRRQALAIRPWTDQEKAQETELLAALDRARAEEVSWSSPTGDLEIPLNDGWSRVLERAGDLPPEQMADLLDSWAEARTAWYGPDLVRLLKLRNEVARRAGYPTYWHLAMAARGLEPRELDQLVEALEPALVRLMADRTRQLQETATRLGVPLDFMHAPRLAAEAGLKVDQVEIDAWFDADLAEERVLGAFADVGLPLDGVQIYTGPRRTTRPGAYSFPLRPPEHLAVVLSVDGRWSTWPYLALLHELGLASWWRNLPEEAAASPVLWSPPDAWFEGYGQFFERMLYEPAFLARYVPDVPEESRQRIRTARVHALAEELVTYLGSSRIERRLYEDPDAWRSIVEEAARLERSLFALPYDVPVGTDGIPATRLARSSLLLHYPAYIQNYLVAATVEANLWEAVSREVGEPPGNASVGPFLVDRLIRPVATGTSFGRQVLVLNGNRPPIDALMTYLGP